MTLAQLHQIVTDMPAQGDDTERRLFLESMAKAIKQFGADHGIDPHLLVAVGLKGRKNGAQFLNAVKARLGPATIPPDDQRVQLLATRARAEAVFARVREQAPVFGGAVEAKMKELLDLVEAGIRDKPVRECKVRFELSRNGQPIATALLHPNAILIAAECLPEGEYSIGCWCSCPDSIGVPEPWGRLSNYGGGIAVVRRTNDGTVWRSDPI